MTVDSVAKGAATLPSPDRREGVRDRFPEVHELAVRLTRGETIELTDGHGRRWRASSTALVWIVGTDEVPVIEGDAYEVAERLAGLSSRS
jgi:hypothetical protein